GMGGRLVDGRGAGEDHRLVRGVPRVSMRAMREDLFETRALVTGGTGFLGSHLVRRLVSEGAEVHLLVRPTSSLTRLEDAARAVRCHPGDLLDLAGLRRLVTTLRPLKVFHLAAYTDVARTFDNADEVLEVNLRGTINLLRALEGTNYDCFVYTGSCEEY